MDPDRTNAATDVAPPSPSARKQYSTKQALLVLAVGIVVGLLVVWPLMRSAYEKGRATTNPAAVEAPR